LQEIKATYWYTMFEYGNVMLYAKTLTGSFKEDIDGFFKANDAHR
jgi:hypothetical protein